MEEKQFDLTILGAGPGGYVAALRAAQNGLKVALIEKDNVGGMCLNWGCIPSKTLLTTAQIYDKVRQGDRYGLTGVDFSAVKPDWKGMNKRAADVVKRLTNGVKTLLKKNGVETFSEEGFVIDPSKVKVNDLIIKSGDLIIATGSHYPVPDFAVGAENFHTPKTIYAIDEFPQSISIVGAGVIGVEFALLFSSLGAQVNLVEKSREIMPYLDDDLLSTLKLTLKKRKVKTYVGYEAVEIGNEGLVIQKGNESLSLKSDIYLSAITRRANLTGLDELVKSGLELHRGYIRTDLRCHTSIPHVYAVGDVNGLFMLAHVASAEGTAAVDTIMGKGKDLVYDMMPYNMYGRPEFASVGLTEKAALDRGFLVATGKFPFLANGKALAEGNADGFVKVVYDKQYGEILGVHIAAENATDLISEAVMAMRGETTVWDVASAVHPHPTLSEAFLEATFKALEQPLHTL